MLNNQDTSAVPLPNLALPSGIFERVQALVRPTWLSDVTLDGQLVRLYRDYVEGRQRSFLTQRQRAMLNIKSSALEQLYINYCELVVDAMADRLTVTSIDGDSSQASKWSAEVLAFNRFDGLQMDVTDGTVGDGATYLMVDYDNAAQMPRFSHEPAWDGYLGVIPIYDRMLKTVVVAIKVWYENSAYRRFNIYWPDRIEKYIEAGSEAGITTVVPLEVDEQGLPHTAFANGAFGVPWVDKNGLAVGVPILPFRNRKKSHRTSGISAIASVIPLQDGLNRTLIDMLMTSGLTAFQIRVALGFNPPDTLAPGEWVVISGDAPPTREVQVDARVLETGQIVPFISQASFLIDQIGTVSQTPLPTIMGGDNSSGEALKQREVGLLSKVGRFQTKVGNDWEDAMTLAARVQDAFGNKAAPVVKRWNTRWQDAQTRSDGDVIANAMKVQPLVGDEEALHLIAPVYGYDEAKIKALLAAKGAQRASALAGLNVPGFDHFGSN